MKKKIVQQGRKIRRFFRKYVNGTKGIISIFLVLLMLPFLSIAGILINAARVNSALAIFDEALCNASNSTLGTYDDFLRKRFGLLAVSQSGKASGYTEQEFINDLFQSYVDENMKVLNNTYDKDVINATGIFPLGNKNVLKEAIYEASKYSVPTKLAMDGLFIEDLLKKLCSPLDKASKFVNCAADLGEVVVDADKLAEKLQEAQDDVDDLYDKISAYNTAYNDFIGNAFPDNNYNYNGNSAVHKYNSEVAKQKKAVQDAQNAYNTAQTDYSSKNSLVVSFENNHRDLVNGYNACTTDKERDDYKKAHSDIQDYIDLVKDRDAAATTRDDKETALNNAKDAAEAALSPLRTEVSNKLDAYKTAVDDLNKAASTSLSSIQEAQQLLSDFVAAMNTMAKDAGDTVGMLVKDNIGKNETDLKKELEDLKKVENPTAEQQARLTEVQNQLNIIADDKADVSNLNTLGDKYVDNKSNYEKELIKFAKNDYTTYYNPVISGTATLSTALASYVVPDDQVTECKTSCAEVTDYYVSVKPITNNIARNVIVEIMTHLAEETAKSSVIQTIKMIIKFLIAIIEILTGINIELISVVVPSKIPTWANRSKLNDAANPYDAADKKLYDENMKLLQTYASSDLSEDYTTKSISSIIEEIQEQADKISKAFDDMEWYNFFIKIGEIIIAIGKIVILLVELFDTFFECLAESFIDMVKQRIMLTGYCAYNLANRTTYDGGKALTGYSYDLPSFADLELSGLTGKLETFSGAEFEYILCGWPAEAVNVSLCYDMVLCLRIINNVGFVCTDEVVQGIADAAGSVTFGIGTVVVFVLWTIAESLVDMVILIGGNSVPIVKLPIFLSPNGIPDLISRLTSIALSTAAKTEIKSTFGELYSDDPSKQLSADQIDKIATQAPSKTSAMGWVTSIFQMDYTQHLMLLSVVCCTNNMMLERLEDIIQMESQYHALKNGYNFSIFEAYTWLRVSGQFETNEFVRISGMNEEYSYKYGGNNTKSIVDRIFKSDERIIYRGY